MSSKFRRVSRIAIIAACVLVGAALVWRGVVRSPIVSGASVVGVALTVAWMRRRDRQHLGAVEPRFSGPDLVLSAMLVGGLWMGLYAVFSLGDVGARSTSIPLGHDGAPLGIAEVLGVGLMATLGVTLLLVPFRRVPKKRRDVRETSLARRRSAATP